MEQLSAHQLSIIPPGTLLGQYQIHQVEKLEGYVVVYAGTDTKLNRPCTVKQLVVRSNWSAEQRAQMRDLFRQEIEHLVQINTPGHASIPEIYDVLPEIDGLAMKYIDGRTLEDMRKQRGGRLPEEESLLYIRQICEALAYLNSRTDQAKMVPDLRLEKLICDNEGRIWLPSFQLLQREGEGHSVNWRVGQILYTLLTDDCPPMESTTTYVPIERSSAQVSETTRRLLSRMFAADFHGQPDITELLTEVEDLLKPMMAFEAPDGQSIPNIAALAQWCEQHWSIAVVWLYGTLPEQIEHFWRQYNLAEQLQSLVIRHADDAGCGLDAALALLDSSGYGIARPQFSVGQVTINYGLVPMNLPAEERLAIHNTGRRYLRIHISTPRWLRANPSILHLPPGAKSVMILTTRPRIYQSRKTLQGTVELYFETTEEKWRASHEIPVLLKVGLYRFSWHQFRHWAVLTAVLIGWFWLMIFRNPYILLRNGQARSFIITLILYALILIYFVRYSVNRRKVHSILREMPWFDTHAKEQRENEYYQEVLDSIEARNYNSAAEAIHHLETIHPSYPQTRNFIQQIPELRRAFNTYVTTIQRARVQETAVDDVNSPNSFATAKKLILKAWTEPPASIVGMRFVPRLLAYSIDLALIMIWVVFAFAAFSTFIPEVATEYTFAGLLFFAHTLYFSAYTWLFGSTPGKLFRQMKVVQVDGSRCGLWAALIRSLLVPFDSVGFGLLAYTHMRYPSFQRFGDKMAHTVVMFHPKDKQDRWRRAFILIVLFYFTYSTLTSIVVSLIPYYQQYQPVFIAPQWQEIQFDAGHLSVEMPLKPQHLQRSSPESLVGRSDAYSTVYNQANYLLSSATIPIPPASDAVVVHDLIFEAAQTMIMENLKIIEAQDIIVQTYPGKELVGETNDSTLIVKVRIIVVPDHNVYHRYILRAQFPSDRSDLLADAERFLQSLQFQSSPAS